MADFFDRSDIFLFQKCMFKTIQIVAEFYGRHYTKDVTNNLVMT